MTVRFPIALGAMWRSRSREPRAGVAIDRTEPRPEGVACQTRLKTPPPSLLGGAMTGRLHASLLCHSVFVLWNPVNRFDPFHEQTEPHPRRRAKVLHACSG